jgi:tRNA(fMet)-specific endonuclease VapC
MGARYLLDTNAAIAAMENPAVLERGLGLDVHLYVSMTMITVGELSFGAYRSARVQHNLQRLEQFLHSVVVLPFDRETADEYGRVSSELRRKGRPIPANDIWIVAQARQYELPLVTRDGHFKHVEGIQHLSW